MIFSITWSTTAHYHAWITSRRKVERESGEHDFPFKGRAGCHIQCLCSDPTGHHLFSGSLEEAMCQVKDNGHQGIIAINPVCMLNLQNVAHFQHFPRWGFKPSFCHPSDLPLLILFFSLWFVTLCLFVSVSFLPSTNYSYL